MDVPVTVFCDFNVRHDIDTVLVQGTMHTVPMLIMRSTGTEWRAVMTPNTRLAMQPEFRVHNSQLEADPMAKVYPFRSLERIAYVTIRDEDQVVRLHFRTGAVGVLRLKTDGRTWVPNGVSAPVTPQCYSALASGEQGGQE